MRTQMGVKTYDDRRDERVTVLGPCPGCDAWQVDYTETVAQQWIRTGFDSATGQILVIQDLWYAVVEDALREHMLECPHLRDLVEHYDRVSPQS